MPHRRPSSRLKPKPPSNKFLEALDQIERAMYAAQASGLTRHSSRRLAKIKANIKLATQQRNYLFARQSLGHALYSAVQIAKKGRKKRSSTSTTSAVKTFMDSVKKDLGSATFETFMSVKGDVTLMFAIDDTGSMGDEIQAAKDIAKSIVNHPRDEKVDYILSPFNDPKTGPLTYKKAGKGKEFEKAIEKLHAHGGGDCPELTFKGILDAIAAGPNYGSPLYAFTDASAKDATTENIEDVLLWAEEMRLTINFFTTGLCGLSTYKPFEDLAKKTCGYMFNLPRSSDLKRLSSITSGALVGATCLHKGGRGNASGKKKRSTRSYKYRISIDDSTEEVFITVKRQSSSQRVTLKNPRGFNVNSGVIKFPTNVIYKINKPRPGTWMLTVSGYGKHSYQVKGISKTNVDFEYFFVMIPAQKRKMPIPITHPIIGEKANVIITVAGNEKINKRTLKLDLLRENGALIGQALVSPRGTSGAHFTSSFDPPSVPFTLKLRGKTKNGYNFERLSHNVVQPSPFILRVLRARNEYTIPVGRSTSVTFTLHNNGMYQGFDIKVKDRLKYFRRLRRSTVFVPRGRRSFFTFIMKAPSSAPRGKGVEVVVSVTGRKSKRTVREAVRLMVV